MADQGCVLYSFPPLPNPQKARLALEEFGVPYTVKNVNVMAGENLAPEFLQDVNSNGTLPVFVLNLDTGRKVVADSKDIVMNSFNFTRPGPIENAALVTKWVDNFDAWNGPLYTLANDAVLKRLVLSVNAYKTQLSEARQKQYPALAEAYAKNAARFRQGGKTSLRDSISTQTLQILADSLQLRVHNTVCTPGN